MSNRSPLEVAEADTRHFAEGVLRVIEARERKLPWLAEKTGISESTLRYQLKTNPTAIRMHGASAIANVLGMTYAELCVAASAADEDAA